MKMKTKISKRTLVECDDGQMVDFITQAVLGDDMTTVQPTVNASSTVTPPVTTQANPILKTRMAQYAAMCRAMELWFHAAHHTTRGTAFFGDHADLYGTLYDKSHSDFDDAVEKAIGLTNDEGIANPLTITTTACKVLANYPTPTNCTALSMASTALEIEKDYIELVTAIFHELEGAGSLSLGLDDMLMATVNEHEGHVYKLQQRVKTALED